MGLMSQSLFNLKSFSRTMNNITRMRRYNVIRKASQRGYTTGSSQEKPSWIPDDTGYYKPETRAKELDPYIVTTSKIEVKTRIGEELWWMPDQQTGFYRPDNSVRELDAVDLRAIHFNNNKNTL